MKLELARDFDEMVKISTPLQKYKFKANFNPSRKKKKTESFRVRAEMERAKTEVGDLKALIARNYFNHQQELQRLQKRCYIRLKEVKKQLSEEKTIKEKALQQNANLRMRLQQSGWEKRDDSWKASIESYGDSSSKYLRAHTAKLRSKSRHIREKRQISLKAKTECRRFIPEPIKTKKQKPVREVRPVAKRSKTHTPNSSWSIPPALPKKTTWLHLLMLDFGSNKIVFPNEWNWNFYSK